MTQRTQSIARRTVGAAASVCPLPSPEKVFADWLLWVPLGVDLRAAAREQIALIDRYGAHHPDIKFLRTLLAAVAEARAVHESMNEKN
jgi:hypothetical protein